MKLPKIKDVVDTLSKNMNVECTELNGDYCIIHREKDIAKHIFRCAGGIGLDVSLEEVPFSLTVNYYKIMINGKKYGEPRDYI